jgi:hypothetical protein
MKDIERGFRFKTLEKTIVKSRSANPLESISLKKEKEKQVNYYT